MASGMLSISSRNSVPPLACSSLPGRAFTALVNAPASCPKNSLSTIVSGNAGAIDRDVVAFVAPSEIVQAARDQVLADAGLAVEDDAHVGAGELGDGGAQIFRRPRGADDARVQRLLVDGAAQPPVLDHELALLAGVPHDLQKALGRERLLDEVVGAEPHRLDRDLDVAMAGDHDDGQLGIDLLRAAQQLQPVDALHLEIGDQHAGKIRAQLAERRRGVVLHRELEARELEPLRDRFAHRRLVVDEQDVTFRHEPSSPGTPLPE